MKKNAAYLVRETFGTHYRKKGKVKVLRDEIITLGCHPEDENGRKITKELLEVTLRRLCVCCFAFGSRSAYLGNVFDELFDTGIITSITSFLYKELLPAHHF